MSRETMFQLGRLLCCVGLLFLWICMALGGCKKSGQQTIPAVNGLVLTEVKNKNDLPWPQLEETEAFGQKMKIHSDCYMARMSGINFDEGSGILKLKYETRRGQTSQRQLVCLEPIEKCWERTEYDYTKPIFFDAVQREGSAASKADVTRYLLNDSTITAWDGRRHFTDINGNEWITAQPYSETDKTGIWK